MDEGVVGVDVVEDAVGVVLAACCEHHHLEVLASSSQALSAALADVEARRDEPAPSANVEHDLAGLPLGRRVVYRAVSERLVEVEHDHLSLVGFPLQLGLLGAELLLAGGLAQTLDEAQAVVHMSAELLVLLGLDVGAVRDGGQLALLAPGSLLVDE